MIVLGIDTSGYANAVGIVNGRQVLADRAFEAKTDSLEQIVANIDDVLKGAGLTLGEVQGIGVGLGPGSWTGIRVGVTVGKMLAFSAGKPVAGVSTLEALAYAAGDESRLVCPVINVGTGGAIYAACYRLKNGDIAREGEYFVGDVRGLAAIIKEPCVMVGMGVSLYAETVARASGKEVRAIEGRPGGAAIASLAARRLERGESDNVLALAPLYLKESTAKAFVDRYRSSHS
jgi:tRNA threonylcarbamoyladenosine biosynthesis protein TsaB